MVIQVIATLFAAGALLRLSMQVKNRRMALRYAMLWALVWVAVITVFWVPGLTSDLALYAGIGRGADLVVYTAILVLMYLQYRFFERIERLQRDITTLTRQLALRDDTHKENRTGTDRHL